MAEGDKALAEELRRKGIRDPRVLAAIASLNRLDFVPREVGWHAGEDRPLPIGSGQTISQPYIVAFMTEALGLLGGERVLEIGTGSGYQTAVLARMGADVYSIEIIPELARQARERLGALEAAPGTLHLREGDGSNGWPEAAPFDAILLTASPRVVPRALLEQLKPGGALVAPVGGPGAMQELVRMRVTEEGHPRTERLLPVAFVPMTGAAALPELG